MKSGNEKCKQSLAEFHTLGTAEPWDPLLSPSLYGSCEEDREEWTYGQPNGQPSRYWVHAYTGIPQEYLHFQLGTERLISTVDLGPTVREKSCVDLKNL